MKDSWRQSGSWLYFICNSYLNILSCIKIPEAPCRYRLLLPTEVDRVSCCAREDVFVPGIQYHARGSPTEQNAGLSIAAGGRIWNPESWDIKLKSLGSIPDPFNWFVTSSSPSKEQATLTKTNGKNGTMIEKTKHERKEQRLRKHTHVEKELKRRIMKETKKRSKQHQRPGKEMRNTLLGISKERLIYKQMVVHAEKKESEKKECWKEKERDEKNENERNETKWLYIHTRDNVQFRPFK